MGTKDKAINWQIPLHPVKRKIVPYDSIFSISEKIKRGVTTTPLLSSISVGILVCLLAWTLYHNFFCDTIICKSQVYQLINFQHSFAQAPEPDTVPQPKPEPDYTPPPEPAEPDYTPQPEPEPDYTPQPEPEPDTIPEPDTTPKAPEPDTTPQPAPEPDTTPQPIPNGNDGSKSACLIATAAFGSELSPQVQFLRNFRDEKILSTISGSSFMNVFNSWYYSFSPQVANYERHQPWLQVIFKASIYPLLGILQLSEKSYSLIPGEYGSIVAGIAASSLIGMTYFTPFALCIRQIRVSKKFDYRLCVLIAATVTAALVISLLVSNQRILLVTTPLFVVTVCAISSILSARMVSILSKKLNELIKTKAVLA